MSTVIPRRIRAATSTRVSDLFAGPVRDYSVYANQRAIPSIVDGFKPSQRKVIYGTLKKRHDIDHDDGMKVAQLGAFIAAETHYKHGEGSLSGTIVGMAQNFRGSNNLNYLRPIGQFGSLLSPEAAADRYIYTDINPIFDKIFLKDDELILEAQEDDGDPIEPRYFLPIIPNVLVNGANGMGTGFATSIGCYNPEDLRRYCLNRLQGKKQSKLTPWYRGFKGKVEKDHATGQITFTGILEKVNSTTIRVTELPIGTFQDAYKERLLKLEDAQYIKSFDNNSTMRGYDVTITSPRTTTYEDTDVLYKKFGLVARMTENLTVWLENDKLKCFDTVEALCDHFVDFRLTKFEERRQALIAKLTKQLALLNEKLRFVRYYIANADKVAKRTRVELVEILTREKFTLIDQLLEIKIYNLTKDQIEKLEAEITEIEREIKFYRETTATELYVSDLEKLDLRKELVAQEELVTKKR